MRDQPPEKARKSFYTDSASAGDALAAFHPLVQEWFREHVGTPTAIQQAAWPVIARGEHVLVSAPTGSGKTLTAFLWSLNQMLTGAWAPGNGIRTVYVSPLKALNNDINRNLSGPLFELRRAFAAAGVVFPEIRVMTRSGDTPASERSRMLRRPPDILITTPESLNILLTSRRGRALFAPPDSEIECSVDNEADAAATGPVRTVILDEIHAVVPSRRGTHLMTAVERLARLSGEFQRIALSATVRPLDEVAQFVGGYELVDAPAAAVPAPAASEADDAAYRARSVRVIEAAIDKQVEIEVRTPGGDWGAGDALVPGDDSGESEFAGGSPVEPEAEADAVWIAMAREFRTMIQNNRSTLFFTNSRRLAEKMTRLINEDQPELLALCHHGSLSREIRLAVEERLKAGQLRAIVATSSLELGIDVGSVDQVVLIQTPWSVAASLQRIGRAGHGVGQVSRGVLYPAHDRDILEAALMARAVMERDIEAVVPVRAPLDVLAQVIVSMVANQTREIDEVFAELRCAYACHGLERRLFDLVLEMLAGRYARSRIRELRPRISIDRIRGRIEGRAGVERVLYMSGGTIPDRGYFDLRVSESNAKIGQLDEEFVWERAVGEVFGLGNQHWQIVDITHNDVFVTPGNPQSDIAIVPFWRADQEDRGAHFADRLREFLLRAENEYFAGIECDDATRAGAARAIDSAANAIDNAASTRAPDNAVIESSENEFAKTLAEESHLQPHVAGRLLRYLRWQRAATGVALPHRQHIVAEYFRDPADGHSRLQLILHTFWGGRTNRPLALAFQAAFLERYGAAIQAIHNDDAVLLVLPEEIAPAELFALIEPERLEDLLRISLEPGGFFGARFRESAGRALLLPPSGFGQRLPLWLNRQRSKKLLGAIRQFTDFPILLETWRACFHEAFEMDRLRALLTEVHSGEIEIGAVHTRAASPFAADLIWRDTNTNIYEDDARRDGYGQGPDKPTGTTLDEELLQSVVFSGRRRPRIPEELRREFQAKLQRSAPGYAPRGRVEIIEWVKDRVAIPVPEWEALLASLEASEQTGADPAEGVRDPGREGQSVGESEFVVALTNELREDLCAVLLPGAGIPAVVALETLGSLGEALAQPPAQFRAMVPWLARFLRYYGPVSPELLALVFGLNAGPLSQALELLAEDRLLIRGALRADSDELCVCDADNFESLLRMLRRRSRPRIDARPLGELAGFLAQRQGLLPLEDTSGQSSQASRAGTGDLAEQERQLQRVLDQLSGFPAPPAAWEEEIFPARLGRYYTSALDRLFQNHDLVWFAGSSSKAERATAPVTIAFALLDDLEFVRAAEVLPPRTDDQKPGQGAAIAPEPDLATRVLLELAPGPQSLPELAARCGAQQPAVEAVLWSQAGRGLVSAMDFQTLRRGIEARFQVQQASRSGRQRWGRGSLRRGGGTWYALDRAIDYDEPETATGEFEPETMSGGEDLIEQETLIRERVRLLFTRYGVLFRELLTNEAPLLRWSAVFRQLRLMELSGEILGGYFFEGAAGLQFMTPAAYRTYRQMFADARRPDPAALPLYSLGAKDPAALAGLQSRVPALRGLGLPERKAGIHYVFRADGQVILIARRKLSALELTPPPGDPVIQVALSTFQRMFARDFRAPGQIQLETINGEPALKSPYKSDLLACGFESDYKFLTLRRAPGR